MTLSLSIFALTLGLVIVRPRPLNEAMAASIGALVMVVVQIVSPGDVLDVLGEIGNVLLFFLGLMIVCCVADEAGFFRWSAHKALSLAGGNARKLLLIVLCLGAGITVFFSNDATALILTPIVFVLVTRLKLNPLPFVFACAFIANTASMVLPVSNPVNLLPVDRFHLTLGDYLRFTLPASLLAISLNVVLFMIIFRKDIAVASEEKEPPPPVKVDGFFVFTCGGLAITAIGYLLASLYGKPLSWPALAGAALLMAGALAFRRLEVSHLRSGISWSILPFIFSLAVLVRGLDNSGVTDVIGRTLANLCAQGALQAVLAVTFFTALGANLINNWSMMILSVSSLATAGNPAPLFHENIIYSAILGADLGPNISILGSLSSMLWLVLLRRRGLDIHPLQYLKLGLLVTPPLLLSGALCIYVCGLVWD